MNITQRIIALVALLLALPAALHAAEPAKPAAKPNILIILVDDMGYSDFGCFGSEIKTPNIDRRAAGGMKFAEMVRDGQWKLVRDGSTWELYDMAADRNEMHDLAAKRPELVKQMDAAWLAWWKDCTGSAWTAKAPKEGKDE